MFRYNNGISLDGNAMMKSSSTWTWLEDKAFEEALVMFPEELSDRWLRIASRLPGKSPEEVKAHYDDLVHDILIESGGVQLPNYYAHHDRPISKPPNIPNYYGDRPISMPNNISNDDLVRDVLLNDSAGVQLPNHYDDRPISKPNNSSNDDLVESGGAQLPNYYCHADRPITKPDNISKKAKRGTRWTEEEHRLFLLGLQTYGEGDWRAISRNVLITKTATQIASHAQKYFIRQSSDKKDRKRASIHDIELSPPPSTAQFNAQENSTEIPDEGKLIYSPTYFNQPW
ncbi:hypothetical protein NMG60_11008809 [Bertholletia excelsa]